jgi:hypothetical protein
VGAALIIIVIIVLVIVLNKSDHHHVDPEPHVWDPVYNPYSIVSDMTPSNAFSYRQYNLTRNKNLSQSNYSSTFAKEETLDNKHIDKAILKASVSGNYKAMRVQILDQNS